jgi:alpha-L-arabinofuranosidase
MVWNVKSAGTTGAAISGSSFNATAAGTATVTATIANGSAVGTAYTKDFTITVKAAPSTPTLTLSRSTLDFSSSAGSESFTVASNVANWSVTSNQTWATVSPASGSNSGTVNVTVTANTNAASRTATITVSGTGVTAQTVTVTQNAAGSTPTLDLSVSSLTFDSDAGQETFDIASNVEWSVGSNAAWLTISPASGSNNGTVTVSIAANTTGAPRTATITISGSGMSTSVTITQSNTQVGNEELRITNDELRAFVEGGVLYVSGLKPGKPWNVYSLSGALIYTGVGDVETLRATSLQNRGVYIVTQEGRSVKVVKN